MIKGAQLRLVVRPQPQECFVGVAAGVDSWGGSFIVTMLNILLLPVPFGFNEKLAEAEWRGGQAGSVVEIATGGIGGPRGADDGGERDVRAS